MTSSKLQPDTRVAVIGGGPAGLMAAQTLAAAGLGVDLYDAMPSVGRKFLLAGKGGLNLTHAEAPANFVTRYGARAAEVGAWLDEFGPDALRGWARDLGIETFVGSSGRVFPADMKAAPLLRAWLQRLRAAGVQFHMRQRWLGSSTGTDGSCGLRFAGPDGEREVSVAAAVLALGGGSWARLGSDGAWLPRLAQQGVAVTPLQPANCGFDVGWSAHFSARFAGQPLKSVVASFTDTAGRHHHRAGELMISAGGVEGSLVYAWSAPLRDSIATAGAAVLQLDLAPARELRWVADQLARPRGSRSLSSHLQRRLGLAGVKAGLLRELVPNEDLHDPRRLAAAIKALPLRLLAPRPLDEAISSAGGVLFEALDAGLMLRAQPGLFCAGEMLDWEAPTGGYLLTACFASGRRAGRGVLEWLARDAG